MWRAKKVPQEWIDVLRLFSTEIVEGWNECERSWKELGNVLGFSGSWVGKWEIEVEESVTSLENGQRQESGGGTRNRQLSRNI